MYSPLFPRPTENIPNLLTSRSVMDFYEWLIKQRIKDSPEGDFVDDTRDVKDFPRNAESYDQVYAYLRLRRFACEEAIEAGKLLWARFKGMPLNTTKRGSIAPKLRFYILSRDCFACVLCGAAPPDAKLEIDHIMPIAKGGTNDKSNLQTLCFECNRGKGADYSER